MLDHADFGTTLQDEILPYHLEYYLGIKKEYGGYGGEEGEGDDDDDSDAKSKGSDASSGSEKPKKKVGGAKKGAPAGGAPPKQECKQQWDQDCANLW